MLNALKEKLEHHGILPRKERGQNFLFHIPTLQHIAAQCPPDLRILEIGPGPGSLTFWFTPEQLATCILVERDPRFSPLLLEGLPPTATLIVEDALIVDWTQYVSTPTLVVGNLPYNVSVPILLRWLALGPLFPQAIFMFQAEVAMRILAACRTSAYGRLSIMAQHGTQVRELCKVPRQYFWPCPKVDSTLLHFQRKEGTQVPFELLEELVKDAFGHRRKMLKKNLTPFAIHHGVNDVEGWLLEHGISPQSRAEEISVQQFCALAQSVIR